MLYCFRHCPFIISPTRSPTPLGVAPEVNSSRKRRLFHMYCPSCATQAIEGAKFCKACGLNLNAIAQALGGGVVVSDPSRDREFKRARKQISDGIQGLAIGAALLVAAALPYFLIRPLNTWGVAATLILALGGIIKLFRSIATIVDARIGPKLLDPSLQTRPTGNLNSVPIQSVSVRPSQRLAAQPHANTRHVAGEDASSAPPYPAGP